MTVGRPPANRFPRLPQSIGPISSPSIWQVSWRTCHQSFLGSRYTDVGKHLILRSRASPSSAPAPKGIIKAKQGSRGPVGKAQPWAGCWHPTEQPEFTGPAGRFTRVSKMPQTCHGLCNCASDVGNKATAIYHHLRDDEKQAGITSCPGGRRRLHSAPAPCPPRCPCPPAQGNAALKQVP